MQSTFIGSSGNEHVSALRHQGMLVTDCQAQLRSMLENRFGPEHARFFAEPVANPDGRSFDWYSDAPGEPRAVASMGQEERQQALTQFQRIWSDLDAFSKELAASDDSSKRLRGGVLAQALHFPGTDSLYMVGAQPVLTCWGSDAVSGFVPPQDIMRAGLAAPAAKTTENQDAPQVAPIPVTPAPVGFPWWRALLLLLGGLVLATALFFLAGLVLGPERMPYLDTAWGCSRTPVQQAEKQAPQASPEPQASGVTQEPDPDPALVALLKEEQEKERGLRSRIEDLRRELSARQNACPRAEVPKPKEPEPPVQPEQPEEPPSLAELMPTTPEEPPEPPQEKKPVPPKAKAPEQPKKKEPPKQEPPKKAPKVARGQELQIPEGAFKNNDLSFLEGCWDYVPGSSTLNPNATDRGQYCFDANGRGRRTFTQRSGDVCSGPTKVTFDGSGNLLFDDSRAPCRKSGAYYTKNRKTCVRQANGQTRCSAAGEGNKRWKVSLRRR